MRMIAKLAVAAISAGAIWAQSAHAQGIPYDWSHHHLVFSRPQTAQQEKLLEHNPRYRMQKLWRQRLSAASTSTSQMRTLDAVALQLAARKPSDRQKAKPSPSPTPAPRGGINQDWTMNLGSTATVGAGVFPAKFSFNPIGPANCDNQTPPDFVVFNTGLAGGSSQPTIIAYDNLYSGCTTPSTVPLVYWQYNTAFNTANFTTYTADGSSITSSVIFSGDSNGSQVAFVQNNSSSQASLVILKWVKNSALLSMNTSSRYVSTANYRTCTAPCMTKIAFSGSHNDTNSSPFYDYANDVLYVGDDAGLLHKFTNIFVSGSPAEITGGGSASGWPQTMGTANVLTSPVYDGSSGNVLVGNRDGKLYRIPGGGASTGGGSVNVVASGSLAPNATGIVSPPLVDSQAGKVYVVVQEDVTNGGFCNGGHPCFFGVYQLNNSFASGSTGTEVTLGGSNPTVQAFATAFDNNYFNSSSSSPTGSMYVCGPDSTGSIPTLYQLTITGNSLVSATTGPVLAASSTQCSPITEIYNGTVDRIFMSVRGANKTASPINCPSGSGCVMSFDVTSSGGFGTSKATSATATQAGGTSGIVIDNVAVNLSGASQVYFSTLSNATCAGNGTTGSGTGGCATQASQAGLN